MRGKTVDNVDKAIGRALGHHARAAGGACPDENLIAAYLESRLPAAETAQVEEHASTCASCQEVMALAMKLDQPEIGVAAEALSHKRVLFRLSIPLAALPLVLLALGGAYLIYRVVQPSRPPETASVQVAPKGAETSVATEAAKPALQEQKPIALDEKGLAQDKDAGRRKIPGRSVPPATKQPVVVSAPEPTPSTVSATQVAEQNVAKDAELLKLAAAPQPVAHEVSVQPVAARQAEVIKSGEITPPATPERTRTRDTLLVAAGAKSEIQTQTQTEAGKPKTEKDVRMPALGFAAGVPGGAVGGIVRDALADRTEAARHAIRNLSEEDRSKLDMASARKVGDRVFLLRNGYWIDLACAGRPASPVLQINRASDEFKKISKTLAGLSELLPSDAPILLCWEGKSYLILPDK